MSKDEEERIKREKRRREEEEEEQRRIQNNPLDPRNPMFPVFFTTIF